MTLGRLWAKQGAFEQADVAFRRAVGEGVGGGPSRFLNGRFSRGDREIRHGRAVFLTS
jgi:hypothetical protein